MDGEVNWNWRHKKKLLAGLRNACLGCGRPAPDGTKLCSYCALEQAVKWERFFGAKKEPPHAAGAGANLRTKSSTDHNTGESDAQDPVHRF